MTDLEDGLARSPTSLSEDSGYDNDNESSDGSADDNHLQSTNRCVFGCLLRPTHDCVLRGYDISGRGVCTLSPHTFQYMSSCVVHLDLSNNNITCLPDTIAELKSIRTVNVSKNHLKSVPNTISELINLEDLNVSSNRLTEVPEPLKRLQKLKVFDVSNNYLQTFPPCLELGMGRLVRINLSFNKISRSNKPPLCLSVLQYLDLSHNGFEFFPIWLFDDKCRSMKELDMSFNYSFDREVIQDQIHSLKSNKSSVLKSLSLLNISNVGLTVNELVKNSYLKEFEKLRCLHIGNVGEKDSTFNSFCEILTNVVPLCISELYIPKVGLAGFPDSFFNLKNLTVLDMSNNYLNWLPDNFGEMKSLEELIMTNCTMEFLPKTMCQLGKLRKLVLDKNYLVRMPELHELQALTYLDVYDNELEEFPLSLTQLQTMQHLDLNYNFLDLDACLNYEVDGRNCLEMYRELEASLRRCLPHYAAARRDNCKESPAIRSTGCSSGPSSYHSDLSEFNSEHEGDEEELSDWETERVPPDEEEDWDKECGQGGDDYFDVSAVERDSQLLSLLSVGGLGGYRFGRMQQSLAFTNQSYILKDFLYIPYKERQKKVNRGKPQLVRLKCVVDGQFEDAVEEKPLQKLIDMMRLGWVRCPVIYSAQSNRPCILFSLGECTHYRHWANMDPGYAKYC